MPSLDLDKVYEPARFEPGWADWWSKERLFTPSTNSDKPMFSLVIPPPNVTGALHMGHMYESTQTDITMRFKRMQGYNVLWLPGTDHASIATEMLVTRYLAEQGIDAKEIGREKFLEHAWAWKEKYGGTIVSQLKRVGASLDWTRERFTMDEGLSKAVRETFVRLYEKRLIYRGEYLINWCPGCRTAVSDLETVYDEQQGHLWHIRYPVTNSDEFVTVATTRPETMLGDTAVAVNKADDRYKHLWDKTVTLPLVGRCLPVICDELADPEFGTGVVKVTPAHDPNDFAAGKRNDLEFITILDDEAKINENGGEFVGMDRYQAREAVIQRLEEQGLIAKIEDHTNNVGSCQRCKSTTEPRISTQWFVRTKTLADAAIRAVEEGKTEIVPDLWQRNYFEWMNNIRDWCISRQLWWGHRIPAWYCSDCEEIIVARLDPTVCTKCGASNLVQDDDVLDTWFSSGLWPFSTLGWPEKTDDLSTFYPTSLLNTGSDILFFWVARMMMLGLEMMGDVPFRQVFIHGLVRDADKKKMSKTKGNVIDPVEVTEKYGTDAVRFSLVVAAGQGSDVVLSEQRISAARDFANKIWNAARFVFLSLEKSNVEPWTPENPDTFKPQPSAETGLVPLEDRWIFSRLNEVAVATAEHTEKYRYHEAANLLYHFFWHEFCDWYLELKKISFREDSGLTPEWKNMLAAMEKSLRLLHPVMPFITEELWQRITSNTADRAKSIALSTYPVEQTGLADSESQRNITLLQEVITAVRTLRATINVSPKVSLAGVFYSQTQYAMSVIAEQAMALQRLANVSLEVETGSAPDGMAMHHTAEFDLVLKIPDGETKALRERLTKQLQPLTKARDSSKQQLANQKFLDKAPDHIVDSIRAKLADYESQIEKIQNTLTNLPT
ncbi:MAG: valine--tRNA ligase [Solibacterales bacterium]|nr:valine--tRNA ligase [Bryobacterales bacterium]|tara:strand:+ start:1026 stop:3707 length:2682 start_codon:yes stop_codon:yes gene_type:complete